MARCGITEINRKGEERVLNWGGAGHHHRAKRIQTLFHGVPCQECLQRRI